MILSGVMGYSRMRLPVALKTALLMAAATPVMPTAEGLAALFQRDCIDNAEAAWVATEVTHRLWWDCWNDESSDCASIDGNAADFTIPTMR